jgi:hypothetical protein
MEPQMDTDAPDATIRLLANGGPGARPRCDVRASRSSNPYPARPLSAILAPLLLGRFCPVHLRAGRGLCSSRLSGGREKARVGWLLAQSALAPSKSRCLASRRHDYLSWMLHLRMRDRGRWVRCASLGRSGQVRQYWYRSGPRELKDLISGNIAI